MNIPFALNNVNGNILVSWLSSQNIDMRFGFFSDSIKQLPKTERFSQITTLDVLYDNNTPAMKENIRTIFHCSRCGSTLLCQMLKQLDNCLILGEPTIIGQILKEKSFSKKQKLTLLSNILNIYTQWGWTKNQSVIIKFTSWHMNYFELLREPLNNSSHLFLYREPNAVVSSLVKHPPTWLKKSTTNQDLLSAAANAYSQNIESMLKHSKKNAVALLNFNHLSQSIGNVLDHFKLAHNDHLIQQMKEQMQYDAKSRTTETLNQKYTGHETKKMDSFKYISLPLSTAYQSLARCTNNLHLIPAATEYTY